MSGMEGKVAGGVWRWGNEFGVEAMMGRDGRRLSWVPPSHIILIIIPQNTILHHPFSLQAPPAAYLTLITSHHCILFFTVWTPDFGTPIETSTPIIFPSKMCPVLQGRLVDVFVVLK